ncbi:hydroxyphenylacetyl-CoA thioesterase PaaI [Meiothermus sp. QL-1]|uniref:hydroxyphenylacetyl-CoA thioesterase PaaI n=1 Tax=Meiothermus sp. QL-1 TaxID=2058095 RepID=UPI000E0CBE37|nr:hydroxyphenylacetyl-CoA thioesterase PaaI [Meiothermus sp. QL-1]RDI94953.1 hydroxyphenylacetyl-CoA thioesterase PaaI [Meiothermus sp. QL-1]
MRLLGFTLVRIGPGHATLEAEVRPEHTNIHGQCHGGFLYSLADAAFALASNAHGTPAVALSTSMQYFRPVRVGERVVALAREEHLGRRTATYRIEVMCGERRVALFTGTVFRLECSPKPLAPEGQSG